MRRSLRVGGRPTEVGQGRRKLAEVGLGRRRPAEVPQGQRRPTVRSASREESMGCHGDAIEGGVIVGCA